MGKRWMFLLTAFVLACTTVLPAYAQEEEANPVMQLAWQAGPTKGQIGNRATVEVPAGYMFLGAEGARRLNELTENPPAGVDEYVIAPKDLSWLAYFSFDDVGYVKDDETLNADDILTTIKDGTEQSNAERRSRGWDTLVIDGWSFKPQYDKQVNLLEWAVLGHTDPSKQKIVNYNTRLLGRRGVMQVLLVASPEDLDSAVSQFKDLLPGYTYNSGEAYAEYKAGDHVAEYGLAALVTGGAAAVASKKGFFAAIALFLAKAWKLVLIGVVGIGAFIRKLLGGKDKSAE